MLSHSQLAAEHVGCSGQQRRWLVACLRARRWRCSTSRGWPPSRRCTSRWWRRWRPWTSGWPRSMRSGWSRSGWVPCAAVVRRRRAAAAL